MAVEVPACVDVGETDGLAAQNRGTAVAQGVAAPPNTPVTVTVFHRGHPRHRLLPAACVKNNKHVETERRDVVLHERVTQTRLRLGEFRGLTQSCRIKQFECR